MKLLNALKGISGTYEINRVVGALGTVAYIVGANVFTAWDILEKGRDFDITAYCLAFPAGLGVAVGSIAGSVALKDRSVAKARVASAEADAADAVNASTVQGMQ